MTALAFLGDRTSADLTHREKKTLLRLFYREQSTAWLCQRMLELKAQLMWGVIGAAAPLGILLVALRERRSA